MFKDKRKRTSSEVICELFQLPLSETIYQDYSCSYIGAISFFGRIFIGEQHFCYNSNMFGITKRFSITIDNVLKLDLERNRIVGVYKDAEGVEHGFCFGNFVNAASTFKLMHGLWKGERIEAKILGSNEEEKDGQQEGMLEEGSAVEVDFFGKEFSSSGEKQTVTKITFPCSVEQYYDFFLSDKASLLSGAQFFELMKAQNVKYTEWSKNEELQREVREINAVVKVTGVPMLSQARLHQIQTMSRNQKEIDVSSVTQMSDVPYAAYFTVEQHQIIKAVDEKKCCLEVVVWLTFNKSTIMKRTITSKSYKDLKEDYEAWIKVVQERLKPKIKRSSSAHLADSKLEYENAQSTTLNFSSILEEELEKKRPVGSDDYRLKRVEMKLNLLVMLLVGMLAVNVYAILK